MDKLILGLLMMQRLTIYELRVIIKRYFQSMCSDSIGGIRAAVNKLLNAQMVTYSEFVERSVNKKQYSITDKGREEFAAWAQSPANIALPKNMELGKFLLMGFVPAEKRLQLINEMITRLETTLSEFAAMESAINWADAKTKALIEWGKDDEYREGVFSVTGNRDIEQVTNDISEYQALCIRYEIDMLEFQIAWFKKLKTKLEGSKDE